MTRRRVEHCLLTSKYRHMRAEINMATSKPEILRIEDYVELGIHHAFFVINQCSTHLGVLISIGIAVRIASLRCYLTNL